MAAQRVRASFWLVLSALLATRCSLVYGELPTGQCANDAECVVLGGEGYRCDAQRMCVSTQAGAQDTAATALEAAAHDDCQPDAVSAAECAAGGCAAPLSSDCSCLSGAWSDPSALVVGVIAPRTFRSRSGEVLQIPYVPRWEASVSLALEDWSSELAGGLPRSGRPLALLRCNSNDELFRARRAFTHLTQQAHAPVVITLSDNDTEAIQHQALRQGTAVMCSACFRTPAADLAATSWRVAPPLVDQAPLAAAHALALAQTSAGDEGARAGPLAIVTLSQQYPGIDEFMARVEQQLSAAGHAPVSIQTGDPRSEVIVQPQVAASVIAARPRVIVVGMDSDFTTYYLRLIESGWHAELPRPLYVLTHLNQELGLLAASVASDDELRRRISGTGWHADADVAHVLRALDARFFARHQQLLDQAHYGYDAFYAVSYALAWADPRVSLDGHAVGSGLSRLLAGPPAAVGPHAIKHTLALLDAGQEVDLVGSSSRLDWDPLTHATRSDVGVWCLTRNADSTLALQAAAGPRWSADSEQITGSYSCP